MLAPLDRADRKSCLPCVIIKCLDGTKQGATFQSHLEVPLSDRGGGRDRRANTNDLWPWQRASLEALRCPAPGDCAFGSLVRSCCSCHSDLGLLFALYDSYSIKIHPRAQAALMYRLFAKLSPAIRQTSSLPERGPVTSEAFNDI